MPEAGCSHTHGALINEVKSPASSMTGTLEVRGQNGQTNRSDSDGWLGVDKNWSLSQ